MRGARLSRSPPPLQTGGRGNPQQPDGGGDDDDDDDDFEIQLDTQAIASAAPAPAAAVGAVPTDPRLARAAAAGGAAGAPTPGFAGSAPGGPPPPPDGVPGTPGTGPGGGGGGAGAGTPAKPRVRMPQVPMEPDLPPVLPSRARPGQRIRLPGQSRVTPEEYREFLSLGHGEIYNLDLDLCVASFCGGSCRGGGRAGRPIAKRGKEGGRARPGRAAPREFAFLLASAHRRSIARLCLGYMDSQAVKAPVACWWAAISYR